MWWQYKHTSSATVTTTLESITWDVAGNACDILANNNVGNIQYYAAPTVGVLFRRITTTRPAKMVALYATVVMEI